MCMTLCLLLDPLDVVHRIDGSLGLLLAGESNESEATAATGVTILNDNLKGKWSASLSIMKGVRVLTASST